MDGPTEFEWDESKAAANAVKHGVAFDYAIGDFLQADRVEFDASRTIDGEVRRKAVGRIEGRLFTIVYTLRGDVCRIISARRSNDKEERCYGSGSPHP